MSKRAATGRADLVALVAVLPPERVAGAAALLGFSEPDELDAQVSTPEAPLASGMDFFFPIAEEKPELFWRLEEVSFNDTPALPSPKRTADHPLTADDLTSPGRSLFATPPAAPLAAWSRLWPILRTMLQSAVPGREPDLPALLRGWAQGEVARRIPRVRRRVWAARAAVWVDRSTRLAPFWSDQVDVCRRLHATCGHSGFAVRLLDLRTQEWALRQRGHFLPGCRPDPETPILVLGDLGVYGTPAERAAWLATARRLRGTRIAALLPAAPARWEQTVARAWAAVPWERGRTAARARYPDELWKRRANRLVRLAAPAAFVQPGLLRALRRLLPAGETDASTEVDVFRHRDVRAADSLGLVLHSEAAVQRRQEFAAREPPELQRRVSAVIKHWHHGLPQELLHAETLAWLALIPPTAAPPPGDRDAALAFAQRLEVSVARASADELSATVHRYARTMLLAMPDSVYQTAPALKRVWAAAFAGASDVRVPMEAAEVEAESDPSVMTSWWMIRQLGNRLIFLPSTYQAVSAQDSDFGSPIAEILAAGPHLLVKRGAEAFATQLVLKEGLSIPLGPDQRLELRSDRYTVIIRGWQREPWAVAAGRDRFGLWANAVVKDVMLHFRWIPPSPRFRMGSPGPGQDADAETAGWFVQKQGFWMMETPISPVLWASVMGEPSRVTDHRLLLEESTDALQMFLHRLNVLVPDLEARLPTEEDWKHAYPAVVVMPPPPGNLWSSETGFMHASPHHRPQGGGSELRLARDASIPVSPVYRLASGAYPAVPGSGVMISDTCELGVTGPDLESARSIQNDAMGNITVSSADGRMIIGRGPVRRNKGRLTSGPVWVSDGVCRYVVNNEVYFTVTADNAFEMLVTQSRSDSISEVGQTCKQPLSCKVSYKVAHRLDGG